MEAHEVIEIGEGAADRQRRIVGLTTVIFAAVLAVVALVGHRLHTEEIVLQTRAVDGWAYYQAKNSRAHMYAADAKLAALAGPQGKSVAAEWQRKAEDERTQSEEIQRENRRLDEETSAAAHRATFIDTAEVCLEVAIVLCSVTLLTGRASYWRASFAASGIGLLIAAAGWVGRL